MICKLCGEDRVVTVTETHVIGRSTFEVTFCMRCWLADAKVKR